MAPTAPLPDSARGGPRRATRGARVVLGRDRAAVRGLPVSGQTNPHSLFSYDANGNMTSRERRYDGGMFRTLSFLWDGDNRLRVVNEGGTNRITAVYDGDGVRASKTENWPGASLTHNYSWGPDGLVYDGNANTTYTPGFGQQANGVDRYLDQDWLGSTRYLSDGANGNSFPSLLRFDAFGKRSATGGADAYDSTDLQFAGGLGYQTEFASTTEPGVGVTIPGPAVLRSFVGAVHHAGPDRGSGWAEPIRVRRQRPGERGGPQRAVQLQ
jgi:hypothetical protein